MAASAGSASVRRRGGTRKNSPIATADSAPNQLSRSTLAVCQKATGAIAAKAAVQPATRVPAWRRSHSQTTPTVTIRHSALTQSQAA